MDGKVRWGHRDKKDHPGPLGDKVPRETLVNRVLLGDPGRMVTPEHPETRVLEDLKVKQEHLAPTRLHQVLADLKEIKETRAGLGQMDHKDRKAKRGKQDLERLE